MSIIPQKPLTFSSSQSVSKPLAQGMVGRLVKSTEATKRALGQYVRKSAGGTSALKEAQLARRVMSGAYGGTISHSIMRKTLGAINTIDEAERAVGHAGVVKSDKRMLAHSGDTAREERVLGREVVRTQKPIRDTTELKKRTVKVYQAQRAMEAGETPVGMAGTDRERLQQMEAERTRREYAGQVLESAETGQPLLDADNKKDASAPKPSIPFAQNPGV